MKSGGFRAELYQYEHQVNVRLLRYKLYSDDMLLTCSSGALVSIPLLFHYFQFSPSASGQLIVLVSIGQGQHMKYLLSADFSEERYLL